MILYADTSSLVKLYLDEIHSDLVREWLEIAEAVATSRVALAEALSALARRRRDGDLDEDAFDQAQAAIDADWQHWVLLPLRERRAGELAITHLLRGFDAIHLAAALDLAESMPEESVFFSSFDRRLLEAAAACGLPSLTP